MSTLAEERRSLKLAALMAGSDNEEDDQNCPPAPREMDLDVCEIDMEGAEAVKMFSNTICGCSKRNGAACSTYLTESEIGQTVRMSVAELERYQLDLVLLAQIDAHHFSGDLVGHRTEAERLRRCERTNDYTIFDCRSHNVCKDISICS